MDTLKYFLMAVRPLVEDLLSTIVFGILYGVTGNLTLGIGLGIVVGIAQIAFLKLRGKPIYAMQWMSLALVIVLGSASLLSGNPHFAMFKPSIGSFAVAGVMLVPGWQTRYMPQIVRDNLSPSALVLWGYAWAALIFSLGVANLYVALKMSTTDWVWFNSVVPLSAQFLLFFIQFSTIRAAVRRKILDARAAAAPAE